MRAVTGVRQRTIFMSAARLFADSVHRLSDRVTLPFPNTFWGRVSGTTSQLLRAMSVLVITLSSEARRLTTRSSERRLATGSFY